ncbi:homeobox protein NANOG [Syngnathus scovelli]|uniref:homeobox protein NANOG n=1 Tax=Syngnathus scovelli TaxID=161590 RepID=UPI00210FA429|nr:homeobox protein NANOG [Syngnathus scovelli]
MADWKTQINYNYNASYHAYAYGLMYQSGHDQNHLHVTGWSEGGPSDFNNYTPGMTQVYYAAAAAAARTRAESPPHSPEQRVANGHCHYQTSGLVYLDECQAGRLQAAGTPRADYETPAEESRKAVSDSTSDSEAHASPDSWSFSSGRESGLPQADPGAWVEKDPGIDPNSRSPDAGDHVSSSLIEELPSCNDMGNHNALTFSLQAPLLAPNKLSTNAGTPKGKVRVSFSESQMNALVQRFSVQRYLTPAEMKNLAELTGLTYKQVKTWFQNRRMKLRRHQKDNNWVSERYTTTTTPATSKSHSQAVMNHAPLYQAESQRPPLKEHYNQTMMEPAFKKTSPPNLAFYLARMGNSAASAPYSTWSAGAPQAAMAARSQAVGWSVPPGVNQYDYYPPGAFHSTEPDTSLGGKDAESVSGHNTQNLVVVHDMGQ